MKQTTKIRWVIAHDPLYLFIRAAEFFQEAVNAKSKNHKIEVEIMTPLMYAERYDQYIPPNNDAGTVSKLYELMQAGEIEMSQMVTTNLASTFNKDMHVLDMPFLFKSHDHATSLLEGAPGKQLLTSFPKESNIRGLAFTYSGGFRCLPSGKSIRTLADLRGDSIRTGMNPMARDTFEAIGINPISMEIKEVTSAVANGTVVAGESAWPRIYPCEHNTFSKTVLDTGHSLFLTSIIVSESFWNSLDSELQDIIAESAVEAARMERQRSIEDSEDAKAKLLAEGVEVVQISEQEKEEFKSATAHLYDKYADFFSPGVLQSFTKH